MKTLLILTMSLFPVLSMAETPKCSAQKIDITGRYGDKGEFKAPLMEMWSEISGNLTAVDIKSKEAFNKALLILKSEDNVVLSKIKISMKKNQGSGFNLIAEIKKQKTPVKLIELQLFTKDAPNELCTEEIDIIEQDQGAREVNVKKIKDEDASRAVATDSISKRESKDSSELREKIMANYIKVGGDSIALDQAFCFFDKYKSVKFRAAGDPSRSNGITIDNQRYITINNLNYSMSKSRYYVIDMQTGLVRVYFSAHGYGGKKGVEESDMVAEGLSNLDGSNASPRGFFITGTRREGSSDPRWKFSMKLHGLQQGINDKSFARAIIVHPFPKMPPESASSNDPDINGVIRSDGPFSLSKGCTMLSEKYASDIINKTKAASSSVGGSLYYNYSAMEKSMGSFYCGDERLIKK